MALYKNFVKTLQTMFQLNIESNTLKKNNISLKKLNRSKPNYPLDDIYIFPLIEPTCSICNKIN